MDGTAGLNIYRSGCVDNAVDWYWHQFGCYYTNLDYQDGGDWYLNDYQKSSGTVNGWYRKPGTIRTFMWHSQYNEYADYSPASTRADTLAGCRTTTVALTLVGFASHQAAFDLCQGKIEPLNGGPFIWYGGWTFGAQWVGNVWASPDRTYAIESVSMVHSPPAASYGTQFHLYGEWTEGSRYQ